MAAKIIKLGKKDDIASVVKQIRGLKDKEIVFEVDSNSPLLRSSDNLRLMKRTGEAAGKKIFVSTDDEIGRVLANKAGVLQANEEVKMPRPSTKLSRSDIGRKNPIAASGPRPAKRKLAVSIPNQTQDPEMISMPVAYKFSSRTTPDALPVIKKKFSSSWISKTLIWVIGLAVVAFFVLAVLLPKATITIYARSEPVSRDFEMTVDQSVQAVDSTNLVIPGITVNQEVSQTKTFNATGSATNGAKAAGTVELYNFTPYTLTLKAATSTLTINGESYQFTKDVTGIKPTLGTPQQPVPSSLMAPVPVVAVSGGSAENLAGNQKLTIVNKNLGNLNVYAMDPTGLSGGSDGSGQTVMSQGDYDQAKAALTSAVLAQAESDLSTQKGGNIQLISSGVNVNVLAATADKNVGDVTNSFAMTLIAQVTGLAYNQNDVLSLVKTKINEVLSSDKYLVSSPSDVLTADFKSVDAANDRGTLDVHYETVAAENVDTSNLAQILAGKNESEIKEILLSKPEIDSVTVQFWPMWLVHKAPWFNHKIYIATQVAKSGS